MFRKISLICAALSCIGGVVRAQEPCMTDKMYHEAVKKYPQILDYERQFEAQMEALNTNGLPAGLKATLSPSDTTIFDIPIVVHIVHDYGNEYLSDNVVYEAVNYWAKVYMLQNSSDTATVIAPFKKYIGNPRMRLHLATKDPNGRPTKGVVHDRTYLTTNADDQAKLNQWPQNKYMNFWFINTFGAASTGAAAYAYYPSSASFMPYYDGVIGLYTYINYDKAIPHEIGHVLNLQHTWGNTNNPEVACGNDQVDDTPPTKGHMPVGCTPAALYDTTCATGYQKTYTAAIGGADSVANYPDTVNAENIMDYTYCQKMFTIGQCVRMRNALTNTTANRSNLITATNLASTGALDPMPDLPPVADFSVEKASGPGIITDKRVVFLAKGTGSFNFRNRSWNDTITSVDWVFSNSATLPTTSSVGIVNNSFAQTGWVTVSCIAHSNAGDDTLTNPRAVYVADTAIAGTIGYAQNFYDVATVNNWPMYNYFDNQYKWSYFTGASSDAGDNGCIKYRSFDTTNKRVASPLGDYDDFFTPAFNLSVPTSGNTYINFKTSSASGPNSSGAVGDSLEVDVTTNGGLKWTKLIGYKRGTLVNNGTKSTEFTPTLPTQWVARGVQVPTANLGANTYFRFRYWPGTKGNNLYLDDIHIDGFPAEVADIARSGNNLKIMPNPASTGCTVLFNSGANGKAQLQVKDITGRVVYTFANTYAPSSDVQVQLNRDVTPVAGIYFVTVTADGYTTTEKLVVY